MKKMIWLSVVFMLAFCLQAADTDTKDTVKKAAQKLGFGGNYSWHMDSQQQGQDVRVIIDGKIEKSGLTEITFTFGDRKFEAALKGDKVAFKQEQEWKSADEIEGRGAGMARRLQTFKPPAAEAENLVEKSKELKAEPDGLYSGDLTDAGVKEYLVRFSRPNAPEPTDPKGSVKFWVKDGILQKYEFNLQGTVNPGQDLQMQVNRTMKTDIKDVGTTKLTVPEAAKKKLEK